MLYPLSQSPLEDLLVDDFTDEEVPIDYPANYQFINDPTEDLENDTTY